MESILPRFFFSRFQGYFTKMPFNYLFNIQNPNFEDLGHVIATAKLNEKHDRSAPSDYHWKVLKSRMIIFSNSSLLTCPDKKIIKHIHIVINKTTDDFDKLTSLFLKFSLTQEGAIRRVTPEIFLMCFRYTLTARLAPQWNTLGYNYLINNRDFLTAVGPQDGIQYDIAIKDDSTVIEIKPVKITLINSNDRYNRGECIRVLPSLNKAVVEDYYETLPQVGSFRSYKDLRRHWKNIHGYRLPEEESPYYSIRFWRGDPLTYPKICLTSHFPIITPMSKSAGTVVIVRFVSCLKSKMSQFLGISIKIHQSLANVTGQDTRNDTFQETQAVSLCTPTQQKI